MSLALSFLVVLFLHNADLCRIVQPVKNRVLKGHVMQSLLNRSFEKCAYSCELDAKCFSVNYFTHDGRCEMNNASREMFPRDFKVKEESLYVQNIRKDEKEIDPCKWLKCLHGSTCRPLSKPYCACPVGFKGIMCETVSLKSLGIQDDNIIGDGKLTSSTAKQNHEAWRGRLNRNGSWKPETSDRKPEYRVNFGSPVNITYIATQGSPDEDCWITSFKLKYQLYKGTSFNYPQTFKGNTDRNTVVYHRLTHGHLNGVINLNIQPSSSFGCIGLRLEIYE